MRWSRSPPDEARMEANRAGYLPHNPKEAKMQRKRNIGLACQQPFPRPLAIGSLPTKRQRDRDKENTVAKDKPH